MTELADTLALVARARAGDAAARDELARRNVVRLRLYICARLGPVLARSIEVDDLVQETFLRALRDLDRFEAATGGAFHAWLRTLARHAIVDAARALRRAKRSPGAAWLRLSDGSASGPQAPALLASTLGPATRVALAEEQARIEAALASLSANHRRVIALRQLEGRPAREVARLLGTTEGAVHALYRRALEAWSEASKIRAD